jgi:hypothetical protein
VTFGQQVGQCQPGMDTQHARSDRCQSRSATETQSNLIFQHGRRAVLGGRTRFSKHAELREKRSDSQSHFANSELHMRHRQVSNTFCNDILDVFNSASLPPQQVDNDLISSALEKAVQRASGDSQAISPRPLTCNLAPKAERSVDVMSAKVVREF